MVTSVPYDITRWIVVLIVAVVALGLGFQAWRMVERRRMFTEALAANQPEVARGLLRNTWLATTVQGLALSGVGLAFMAASAVASGPNVDIGLLPGAVILGAGAPTAVYGFLCQRLEGKPGLWGWLLSVAAALAVVGLVFGAQALKGPRQGPSLQERAEFRGTVEKLINAPNGSRQGTVNGHAAYMCLGGMPWGQGQSCGSQFHPQIWFSSRGPGFLNVYYIPDTQQYLVIGRAVVSPSGREVENGFISAQEALGETSPGNR